MISSSPGLPNFASMFFVNLPEFYLLSLVGGCYTPPVETPLFEFYSTRLNLMSLKRALQVLFGLVYLLGNNL